MLTGRRLGGTRVTSSPPMRTVPAVGASKPPIIRSRVVLPQPLGPSSEKNSPRRIASDTSSTAVRSPKRLLTPTISTLCSPVISVGRLYHRWG